MTLMLQSNIPNLPAPHRRKVRDIYDLDIMLLIVSTDRISAFDWVLPTGIPDKGRVLNQISAFWFDDCYSQHHVLTTNVNDIAALSYLSPEEKQDLDGRVTLAKKCEVIPIECVVRGYLDGSGWKEYQQSGTVCGLQLPPGLLQCSKLEEPIFTPATKAATGHDINITFAEMVKRVGLGVAKELRSRSIAIYNNGAKKALAQDIIIADTKFEWGETDGGFILIDEVLTPDSSRFWPAGIEYEPGRSQVSFDKQFVRDWLTQSGWDKNSPPPELPPDIVARTREKYIQAYEKLTGQAFIWK